MSSHLDDDDRLDRFVFDAGERLPSPRRVKVTIVFNDGQVDHGAIDERERVPSHENDDYAPDRFVFDARECTPSPHEP